MKIHEEGGNKLEEEGGHCDVVSPEFRNNSASQQNQALRSKKNSGVAIFIILLCKNNN